MQQLNMLIVDDDIVDRKLITRTLSHSTINCKITEVSSVDEALEALRNSHYNAILLDYNLPKRNGLELLKELKISPNRHDIAVIMMSTSEDDDLALNCLHEGAQDFLIKTDINVFRLQRAIANAQVRADLEKRLFQSYQATKQLAERDSLTGLANRYKFDETLEQNIKNNLRDRSTLALLLIDLDHFKYVNDNFGHDIGDQLLIDVVERINGCLRDNEFFARLGGDEFALTLTHLPDIISANTVAQRIINSLNEAFHINNYSIRSGASIGIAICPSDSSDAKELFKFSDIAMYKAKQMGRSQCSFFEEKMQQEFMTHFNIENQLKTAISNKEFYLHYQPVINAKNNELMGVEALIRWNLDGQMLSPDMFIPIAEKSFLIVDIGRWVIEEAIEQLSAWNKKLSTPITMAINISAIQLTDDGLFEFLRNSLQKNNVSAHLIDVEITETALIIDPKITEKIIQNISDLGCNISLDDFGTGFSSLSHLHSYPINTVKIDKSLMPSASPKKKVTQLLIGLVVMVKSLELEIIAEGVETESDLDLCIKLNVDKFQGYYFDKPMSAKKLDNKYL